MQGVGSKGLTFSTTLSKRSGCLESPARKLIAKLIFLAIVSRLLDRPVSLLLEGESSVGKSYLLTMVPPVLPRKCLLYAHCDVRKGPHL